VARTLQHTLREAERLGLEMSLKHRRAAGILGGPMVTAEDAPKKLVWTETRVTSPTKCGLKTRTTQGRDNFYARPFCPGPSRSSHGEGSCTAPEPAAKSAADGTDPVLRPGFRALFQENRSHTRRLRWEDTVAADVRDLTGKVSADGTLRWQ